MDVDVFANANSGKWRRLEALATQRRLTGAEADELVHLYRQVATHLSLLRARSPEPALVSELSVLLVRARARIASPHDLTLGAVARFFTHTMPAALYRIRWWSVAVSVGCLLVALICGLYLVANPAVLNQLMPPQAQEEYAQQAFAAYYTEHPSLSFTAMVWTNNAMIAALCVATGITGIWPLQVLFTNSLSVGMVGAVMHVQGADQVFWTLILPHGLLELSAVFVAGAAGMRLFWAWVAPGHRTRAKSLAQEGRTTIVVVAALTITLLISGVIEGYVTGYGLPVWLKLTIGVAAAAAFWAITFVVGRRVTQQGVDPGLSEEEARSQVAVAG